LEGKLALGGPCKWGGKRGGLQAGGGRWREMKERRMRENLDKMAALSIVFLLLSI
jgi:hypothetical protein